MSEVTESVVRACEYCSKSLPIGKKMKTKFCSNSCRAMSCRKKKAMPPMSKVYPMPMTDTQIHEAEQKRLAEAYALVQRNEQKAEEAQRACWQEILAVTQKHGFQLTVNYKPVEAFCNLLPIQQGA